MRAVAKAWDSCRKPLSNLGNALMSQGRLDEAAARLRARRWHFSSDDAAAAHQDLGNVRFGQVRARSRRWPSTSRSLALHPNSAEAETGLGVCHLLVGDYERGWPLYESRLRLSDAEPPPNLPTRWQGEPLAGRSLLLVGEQEGLGDVLQSSSRYDRVFKAMGRFRVAAGRAGQAGPTAGPRPRLGGIVPGRPRQRTAPLRFLFAAHEAAPYALGSGLPRRFRGKSPMSGPTPN